LFKPSTNLALNKLQTQRKYTRATENIGEYKKTSHFLPDSLGRFHQSEKNSTIEGTFMEMELLLITFPVYFLSVVA
jgi:hypothetical protein